MLLCVVLRLVMLSVFDIATFISFMSHDVVLRLMSFSSHGDTLPAVALTSLSDCMYYVPTNNLHTITITHWRRESAVVMYIFEEGAKR